MTPRTNMYAKGHFWTWGSLKISRLLRHNTQWCHENLTEMRDGRQAGPKAPESKRAGWPGAGRPAFGLSRTKQRAEGLGLVTKKSSLCFLLHPNAECVYRNFPFWKIKEWLSFKFVGDNMTAMTHIGRQEQINVSGVCQTPKPNVTRLLGPPQNASECILTRCKVTGLSHATGPLPDHEYKH